MERNASKMNTMGDIYLPVEKAFYLMGMYEYICKSKMLFKNALPEIPITFCETLNLPYMQVLPAEKKRKHGSGGKARRQKYG